MAACHSLPFVLSILLLIFISPSLSFSEDAAAKSQKVKLSLYYESLCPYCANFIENQLVKVFNTDLSTIVNLRLVPYGNAQIRGPDKTIICQHGQNECYLNTIHACAINAWPDVRIHFKLIQCIEGQASASEQPEAAWRKCCNDLGFSQQPIDNCYQSGEGTKLTLKYAEETDSLKPPHRFVPWVTVNNQALEEVGFPKFYSLRLQSIQRQISTKCLQIKSARINSKGSINSSSLLQILNVCDRESPNISRDFNEDGTTSMIYAAQNQLLVGSS
ncbi:gamma interferon inducible lysosomal thiol reductase family protein expressed [Citrus sinensis]|uniref:Gamma interferon inducible lysosomal thiol reductase family protein expressed n=1 Tax=Citrus sinensis TaxID=2711 RepID=A0ACB8JWY6_CITSI|nr:gamma interferon inducible lysosomal thiol reductase family protein expressed [Citrus sinensis]